MNKIPTDPVFTPILKRTGIALTAVLAAVALQAQQSPTLPGQSGQSTTDPAGQSTPDRPDLPGQSRLDRLQQRTDNVPFTDSHFIRETTQHNQLEIKIGQLAARKSDNDQVKKFANEIVQDHTQLGQQLQKFSTKQELGAGSKLDHSEQAKYDKLEKASGTEFNHEFAKCMIKGHAKGISHFEKAAQSATDPALRSFAQQALPKLRQHMQMARDVAKAVGLDESTIAGLMSDMPAAGTPGAGVETGEGEKGLNPDRDLNKGIDQQDQENKGKDDSGLPDKSENIPKKK
jgi:putative membrane protein